VNTLDPLFDLTDRAVVVSGGFGQLGQQYVATLLSRGAKVAVLDERGDAALLASTFSNVDADRLMLLKADVTRRAELEAGLMQLQRAWGSPFGLINNAAIDSPPDAPVSENGPFETFPELSWDKVMSVNVKGVMLCCQIFGGAMAAAGRGSIINIGSIYGVVSPDQQLYEYRRARGEEFYKPIAYSTSKSALYNLTHYLATYWAPRVRVNILTLAGVFNGQDPEFLNTYQRRMPIGRMARADEYNGAVVFLLSDASSYMTGAELRLDGGWTAL
jgi:NAD(P)-dependent dehydrogenase (short-subunit alcohol dehydrogenase family)